MNVVPQRLLYLTCLGIMTCTNEVTVVSGIEDCFIEEPSVICEHSLPLVLPENVSRVTVKDFLNVSINNHTFSDKSWMPINYLDITVNLHVNFYLSDYNFFSLKSLKTLGVHSPGLKFIHEKHILHGLGSLRALNLSSCYYLNTAAVLTILERHARLDSLILDQLATDGGYRLVVSDNAFFKLVSALKIRKLSFSGCKVFLEGPLHVGNLSFHLAYLDFSNTTILTSEINSTEFIESALSNIKTVDLTLLSARYIELDYGYLSNRIINPKCDEMFTLRYLFYRVEHIKLNQILSNILKINNSLIDLSECNINLKSLHLRSNNVHYLNITILWPMQIQLFELDLSSNGMKYLSPNANGSLSSLEILHLADNKLYLMASYIEFQYLFSTNKKLRNLDLSNNKLSWLPFTMFSTNVNLVILDLSNNQLASITFEIRHMTKLRFLNMENNNILFIDGSNLNNIELFLKSRPTPAEISFDHNPLICSCRASPFIKWLFAYMKNSPSHQYMCSMNGNLVLIDQYAIDKASFLCVQPKITIASVSASVGILIIICIGITTAVCKRRHRKRARKRANFLEAFKNGILQQKFLCFLSFSSEDEGYETSQIYEHLSESLKELTRIEQEVVCIGSKHLKLGFPIIDEIVRLISESCVGIFVATNHFCQSHWCQTELREAYELDKPIILICKEDIDLTIMTALMLKIFRKFTRAQLVTKEDGRMDIIPDFKHVSTSILELAALQYEAGLI